MAVKSLAKDKIKFLLLEGVHQSAVDNLQANGYNQIDYMASAISDTDLLEKIADVHFVGVRSRTQLTAQVLAAADKLVAIGCFCIGTNQVDLKQATIEGVPVFNAPYSNTRSVAELVLAEIILLMRGIAEKNAKAHRGIWLKSASQSYEIRGKKLGIIGYGNIGAQLSVLAEALGMQVYFYDTETKLPIGNATQVGSLNRLLAQCDAISLHVPQNDSTYRMITAERLAQMRPGSLLINASRGTVVDIDALSQALAEGHLLGAAIDVFPVEPRSNKEEFTSPLRGFDNVFLTPHIGGSTVEAQQNIGVEVSEKLIKYSDNGSTIGSVNFPEVSLPGHPGKQRLLHIHQNRPGVLSAINQIFSTHQINVSAQYLQTTGDIGYVVVDIDKGYSQAAYQAFKQVPGTIRTRILL
jgi:D-3-phosphoglycerate dehydrogenase